MAVLGLPRPLTRPGVVVASQAVALALAQSARLVAGAKDDTLLDEPLE